uniref:Cytochrome c oxidase assembly factor 3 mitochondrial coiled-coil domain-containing protein n=1 Tax=Acrobeloides nanus TaxID=290746 RepID=A0A914DDD5_9BILA
MNRLPIRSLSKQSIFFLRYASKDASSSTSTPVNINKKDSAILAEEKKDYIQVVEPHELPRAYRRYAEVMATQNKLRSHQHMREKKKSWASFAFWVSVAIFIYFYTMHAMKQETFLEQIDDEMAYEWGTETEEQRRKRELEEFKKERGTWAYYLYKWGIIEA